MPTVRVEVEFPKDSPIFQPSGVSRVVFKEFSRFMRAALKVGENLADLETPRGATEGLINSLGTEITKSGPLEFRGEVAWGAPYASTVARGGPPRFVDLGRLVAWADAVLGAGQDAEFIQAAIKLQGTPSPRHPKPGLDMDVRMFKEWEPRACKLFEETCVRISTRLGV